MNHKRANYVHFIQITTALLFILFNTSVANSQELYHIVKDDESGLPSNEVYSIVEDSDGFIWLGSDAGLFRFNGVKYQRYTCSSQASKSISGLCFSTSGKLFCYNFKGQLFCVSNDEMQEIKHPFGSIQDITTDLEGNVILNHNSGIAIYSEKNEGKWKNYNEFGTTAKFVNKSFTKSGSSTKNGTFFITTEGLGNISNGKIKILRNPNFKNLQLGALLVASIDNSNWVFSSSERVIFKSTNKKLSAYHNVNLEKLLEGRKITRIKNLGDQNLWICTYSGVIQFNTATGASKLLFPQYSFSDILKNQEEKLWFSTLYNGLIYLPSNDSQIWNSKTCGLASEKIIKITSDAKSTFFATGNGQLGRIDQQSHEIKLFKTSTTADIQTLYHDEIDHCLYISQSNAIYKLKDDQLSLSALGVPSVKKILHVNNWYFFSSSNGLLLCRNQISSDFDIINRNWNRDLIWLQDRNELWTATNEGIFVYEIVNEKIKLKKHLFKQKQILSLSHDKINQKVYALGFEGEIYQISYSYIPKLFFNLTEVPQVNNLFISDQSLFISSNKGLFSLKLNSTSKNLLRQWTNSSGLASNTVSEIFVDGQTIWIAGGKGVQKFSLKTSNTAKKGRVFLQKIKVGNETRRLGDLLHLKQNEGLTLYPESNLLNDFGNFSFSYRFVGQKQWNSIAGINQKIDIPTVTEGNFELEIRTINNNGLPSENSIHLKGYMTPPFYRTTWFYLVSVLVLAICSFIIFRLRIRKVEEKKNREIKRLKLESDLRFTQQTALKAQMNPHFIFNVLTSIKSFIYANEKQKAANYLSDFSDLIRGILNMTNLQYVSIKEEISFLKTYIDLEAMMLDDFTFELEIDEEIEQYFNEIPSLLIQPFIENAFKHGLHHQSGAKKMQLKLQLRNEALHVVIIDNGIGREQSSKINIERNPGHKSFASSATEKRIKLINTEGRMHVSLEIIDNKPTGTIVQLNIKKL